MKKTSLSHIVNETVVHLNKNKDPVTILPTKAVGVLRNRSVEWLVNGYKAINTPGIVKMVHAPHCICLWISLMAVKDLGDVQSWRDQPFVRVFDVSRSSSGPCSSSQHEPMPPQAPLGHNGSYPEDKDDEDDDALVDSSLSLDEVISWVTNDAPGPLVDISDDEDEGVDGLGHEISRGPATILEPFDRNSPLPTGLGGMEMPFHRIQCASGL